VGFELGALGASPTQGQRAQLHEMHDFTFSEKVSNKRSGMYFTAFPGVSTQESLCCEDGILTEKIVTGWTSCFLFT
jgi:hypothetical protein